jgi:hypothetical protein
LTATDGRTALANRSHFDKSGYLKEPIELGGSLRIFGDNFHHSRFLKQVSMKFAVGNLLYFLLFMVRPERFELPTY